jgi:hypothetical protein
MRLPLWSRRARLWIVTAFTYAFFFSGGDPNQATRFSLTEALVERHAPDITPVHFRTIDKGYKNNHFFADKAPGLSLLATVPFAVMLGADRVFGIPTKDRDSQNAKLYFLSLIFSAAAGVGCAVLFRRLALFLGCSERSAELTAFAYAFGTLAFPFSTVLFGHQLVAFFLLAAFVLALERRANGTLTTPRTLAALGALWSTTIIAEYPAALLVAVAGIAVLAWTFDRKRPAASLVRTLAWTAAGGAPALVIHAAFLVWAYGKFALPYTYVSEPFFKAHMSGGILGVGVPTKLATVGALFSAYRGILFFCPVLGLSLAGIGAWVSSGKDTRILRVVVPSICIYLLFAFSYYAWDGGGSTGPRHLVPILPYCMLPIAFFADRSRATFGITVVVTLISSFIMLAGTSVLVQLPEGDVFAANPLYDIILPAIAKGTGPLNVQDAFIPYGRSDASWNLGTLVGLSPRVALLIVPFVWALAYVPGFVKSFRKAAHV